MIKLNSIVERLEIVRQKLEDKIDALQEKINLIDEKCADEDRDYTIVENGRVTKYTETIEELESECDDVQNAIDYLSDYCEW